MSDDRVTRSPAPKGDLETKVALGKITGQPADAIVGYVVITFDGTDKPWLLSNGDDNQIIAGLAHCAAALTMHKLWPRESSPIPRPFPCPQCQAVRWHGDLVAGQIIVTCLECGFASTPGQLGAQQ